MEGILARLPHKEQDWGMNRSGSWRSRLTGTACSGLKEDRDNPSRYSDSHCESTSPLADFPIQSETLISDNNNIELIRTVEANGQQLMISYAGKARDKSFNTSASIIPQAMNWCS